MSEVVRTGSQLWQIARRKVKVIARINAMKRITLQNYYGVRDDNDFIENVKVNKWVIHPDSKLKAMWDCLIIFLMIYTSTILPFQLAFYDTNGTGFDTFDSVVNYLFAFDILLNMVSAYYDLDNVLVTNNKYILLNYTKTWLIIDVCSVIPFDQIITPPSSTDANGTTTSSSSSSYTHLIRLTRLPRLYRLLKLFKLFRLVRFNSGSKASILSKFIKTLFKMDAQFKRMFKIMALSLLFLHLSACFYYMITKLETDGNTWNIKQMNQKQCVCKYKTPLEFICTYQQCKEKRIICKSCAWDHKQHDSHIVPISEWEQMITNDCAVQRVQHVMSCQGLVQSLESIVNVARNELMKAIDQRCKELISQLGKPKDLNKLLENIHLVQKKNYTQATVELIVKEIDTQNMTAQLNKIESAQYQNHRIICRQIVEMSNAIEKMITEFGMVPSNELEQLRTSISKKIEVPPQKQKPAALRTLQNEVVDHESLEAYIRKNNQTDLQKKAPPQQAPPNMYQSQMNYSTFSQLSQLQEQYKTEKQQQQKMPPQLQQQQLKSVPYAGVLASEARKRYEQEPYERQKSLADFSFFKDQYVPPNRQVDLSKSRADLLQTDRMFEQRLPSQSFHTLQRNKY